MRSLTRLANPPLRLPELRLNAEFVHVLNHHASEAEMRVRCVSDYYNEDTREHLRNEGLRLHSSWHFKGSLTVGKEYLVLALAFAFVPAPEYLGPSVITLPDVGLPTGFPLALFEVIDPRASRYWELCVDVDREDRATEVILGLPSFKATDYWDKLLQGTLLSLPTLPACSAC